MRIARKHSETSSWMKDDVDLSLLDPLIHKYNGKKGGSRRRG